MSWFVIPVLFFFVSCATMSSHSLSQPRLAPPTQGPQMDLEAMRDFHLDKLR